MPPKKSTKPGRTGNLGRCKPAEACPYCDSADFVRRGTRKNKYQIVQLYACRNPECSKTFTAQDVKGKHYPLNIVIEGMNYYNLGFSLEDSCAILKKKFGVRPEPSTLSEWVEEYKELCRYERLRPYAVKKYSPEEAVETVTLAHKQLYRFRYHRAKTALMLEEFPNRRFWPLKDYLDSVATDTPHQYFQGEDRMSEIKSKFDKADMIIRGKYNYADRMAAFVLQAVKENRERHEALERFMLANDSVTVAAEVPVYIRKEDVAHMENILNFKITEDGKVMLKGEKRGKALPKVLTGHIDLLQIRNGQIHILDYKPKSEKEKPIEQLTWYALALSRLTGLRLFEFKCAWFDEKEYFEFYPLHVVKKLRKGRKRARKVHYRSGEVAVVPQSDTLTIIRKKEE